MTAKKQRSLTQILVVVVAFSAKYDQMKVSLLPFAALLSVLFGAAAHGGHDPGHDHHRDLEGPGRRDCWQEGQRHVETGALGDSSGRRQWKEEE